jgi:hypothetical protein
VPWFKSLSNIDKTFLIALVIRVAFGLIARAAGIDPPGFGVIQFVFIVIAIIFLIRSFPKWTRALLWRVRHRLLVTWIFVGVVPIVLICLLIVEGMFVLMGQIIGYMTTQEIARQNQAVRNTAPDFAGLVKNEGQHYLAAHVQLDASPGKPEVFLSQRAGAEFFSNLLPGVAIWRSIGSCSCPTRI